MGGPIVLPDTPATQRFIDLLVASALHVGYTFVPDGTVVEPVNPRPPVPPRRPDLYTKPERSRRSIVAVSTHVRTPEARKARQRQRGASFAILTSGVWRRDIQIAIDELNRELNESRANREREDLADLIDAVDRDEDGA